MDTIPFHLMKLSMVPFGTNTPTRKNLNALRTTLAGFGFHQVYANSLQNEHDAGLSETTAVKMVNPLNREMGFLRTSLLPGL